MPYKGSIQNLSLVTDLLDLLISANRGLKKSKGSWQEQMLISICQHISFLNHFSDHKARKLYADFIEKYGQDPVIQLLFFDRVVIDIASERADKLKEKHEKEINEIKQREENDLMAQKQQKAQYLEERKKIRDEKRASLDAPNRQIMVEKTASSLLSGIQKEYADRSADLSAGQRFSMKITHHVKTQIVHDVAKELEKQLNGQYRVQVRSDVGPYRRDELYFDFFLCNCPEDPCFKHNVTSSWDWACCAAMTLSPVFMPFEILSCGCCCSFCAANNSELSYEERLIMNKKACFHGVLKNLCFYCVYESCNFLDSGACHSTRPIVIRPT